MRGKFVCNNDFTYRMPVHFRGGRLNVDNRVVYKNVMTFQVEQSTEASALAEYIPAAFELLSPKLIWAYCNCRDVDFMSHGEYRIFQVCAPVRFEKDGDILDGLYPLVIFENDAFPILGGREEDGMPKIMCDIAGERRYEEHWFASAAMYCDTILRLDYHEERELSPVELKGLADNPQINNFGYRYIPNVGGSGASSSGLILYPQESHPDRAWSGSASVEVFAPDKWYKNPSMYTTLKALHELPNLGFGPAMRTLGSLRLCVADSKAL